MGPRQSIRGPEQGKWFVRLGLDLTDLVRAAGRMCSHGYPPAVELGTWADWVNAIGTYLAVGGAVFAGIVGLRSYRAQQASTERQLAAYAEEQQRRQHSDRQAHASNVAMWIFRPRSGWQVQWVNASNLPIYRVVVHLWAVEPAFSIAIERGTQGPSVPYTSGKMSQALTFVLEQHNAIDVDPNALKLAVAFTDTAGVRWLRDETGLLYEVAATFEFGDAAERIIDRNIPPSEPTQPQPQG
jgi:hypothetical protein